MDENNNEYFEPIDVSDPRDPVNELDEMKKAIAQERREWIRSHMIHIYAAVGIIVVALIVFLIHLYYQDSNPMSHFFSSAAKDFGTSFDFSVEVTEDNKAVMNYDGSISVNRSKHTIEAIYDAEYLRYSYTGAISAEENYAVKGNLYNNKWTLSDCTEGAKDFFDFDRSFRAGKFGTGAFLRLTDQNSKFATGELHKFIGTIQNRLSTDSSIATVTTEKTDGGTSYVYDVNLYELFTMVKEDGASIFYKSSDYDDFAKAYSMSKGSLEKTKCTISFFEDKSGYMTSLTAEVIADDKEYGFSCDMSNFGKAQPEIPGTFFEATDKMDTDQQ